MAIRSSVKGRSIGKQRENSRVLRGDGKEMNREETFNAHQSGQSNVRRLISLIGGRPSGARCPLPRFGCLQLVPGEM